MIRTREGFNSIVGKLLKEIWANYSVDAIYAAEGFRLEFGQNVIWCAVFRDEHKDSTYLHFYQTYTNQICDTIKWFTSVRLIKGNKPRLVDVWSHFDLIGSSQGDFAYFVQEACQVMADECVSRSIYYSGPSEPWRELTIYCPDVPDTWDSTQLSYFAV